MSKRHQTHTWRKARDQRIKLAKTNNEPCYRCHQEIDYTLSGRHWDGPTAEHTNPDNPDDLAVSHNRCNSRHNITGHTTCECGHTPNPNPVCPEGHPITWKHYCNAKGSAYGKCATCKNEHQPSGYRWRNYDQTWVPHTGRGTSRLQLTCQICGDKFPNQAGRTPSRYCIECREWAAPLIAKTYGGKKQPLLWTNITKSICAHCNEIFFHPSHTQRRYCTTTCQRTRQKIKASKRLQQKKTAELQGKRSRRNIRRNLRFTIAYQQAYKCHHCGVLLDLGSNNRNVSLHIDHVIPVSQGGTDDRANLVASCRQCNITRQDTGPIQLSTIAPGVKAS